VFFNIRYFYPSLIFEVKAGSQPLGFGIAKGSPLVSSSLGCKYETRLKVTDSGKHSSLLKYGKNYCRKKFCCTVSKSIFNLLNFRLKNMFFSYENVTTKISKYPFRRKQLRCFTKKEKSFIKLKFYFISKGGALLTMLCCTPKF
jgi:hypothetical protein